MPSDAVRGDSDRRRERELHLLAHERTNKFTECMCQVTGTESVMIDITETDRRDVTSLHAIFQAFLR
jgi:hypothetical protein